MSGGEVASSARVRIKGRKLSVIRFLILSIAYTIPWVIMLSQLAYYSKVYGPQVLLQMNIAFYLPSIPVLLVAGHVEKLLDRKLGSTASMAIRITAGLAGCAAIAACYPFIPKRLVYLLGLVVGLGSISAIAFSTSYQLVAWFRSADTIALGIGCVASGPLALVIQIALHIGTTPKRWQWIALFEIAAGIVVLGLVSAWSLFLQYWGVMTGKVPYDDTSAPLLGFTEQDRQEDHVEQEAGEQALLLSRVYTLPDPFQGFPFTTTPGMVMPYIRPEPLRRALSDHLSEYSRRSSTAAKNIHRHVLQYRSNTHDAAMWRKAAVANLRGSDGLQPGSSESQQHLSQYWKQQQLQGQEGMSGSNGTLHGPANQAAWLLPSVHNSSPSRFIAAWLDSEHQGEAAGSTPRSHASVCSSSRPASPTATPKGAAAAAAGLGRGEFSDGDMVGDLPDMQAAFLQQQYQQQQSLPRVTSSAPPPARTLLSQTLLEDRLPAQAATAQLGDVEYEHEIGADAAAAARAGRTIQLPSSSKQPSSSVQQQQQLDQRQQQQQVSSPRIHQQQQQQWQVSSPTKQQQQQQPDLEAGKPPLPATFDSTIARQQQQQHQAQHARTGSAASGLSAFSAAAAKSGQGSSGAVAAAAATSTCSRTCGSDMCSEEKEIKQSESLGAVYWEVLQYAWMVVLAALVKSTLLNCIFPFFTYVESSGVFGEYLPEVLFYSRMLADIVGRMLPRKKALAITSPPAIMAMAGMFLLLGGAFFAYLQVPPRMQHDSYVVALVVVLWLGGGYLNTMSYILAPSLVPPRVCTKASALMALTYQVAHILGLVLATGLTLVLYGDISGAL